MKTNGEEDKRVPFSWAQPNPDGGNDAIIMGVPSLTLIIACQPIEMRSIENNPIVWKANHLGLLNLVQYKSFACHTSNKFLSGRLLITMILWRR
jgi:hypothetical protein